MVGSRPEAFAPMLRIQNASLSRSDKSLALPSVRWNLEMAAVKSQMGHLLGPPWEVLFDQMH